MRTFQHHGPGELFGLVFFLLVVALVVIGIVLLVRQSRGQTPITRSGTSSDGGPLRILEERFARGEIDDEEFKRRREILRGSG